MAPLISAAYFTFNFVPFKVRILLVLAVVVGKQSGTMINPQFEQIEGEGALVQKFNTYNNEDYLKSFTDANSSESNSSGISWFITYKQQYQKIASSLIIIIVLFIAWKLGEEWFKLNESYFRLVKAFLALSFLAYLMSLHPSPSASRFIKVAGVFSAIVLAYLVYAWEKMNNGKVHDIVIYPVAYLILFVLVVQTRFGFENFNSAFIFGNPIYVAYQDDPRPLIELYHSIFGVYGNR
jgi:hypothetical protein